MARKKHHEEHMDESWLIPYADILTLLLALFIVLFATSKVDQEKFVRMGEAFNTIFSGAPTANQGVVSGGYDSQEMIDLGLSASKQSQDLQELKEEVDEYAKENNLSGQIQTSISDGSLILTIGERVMFDSGSAEIKPEFINTIDVIANILKQHQNTNVVISGHTDNVPINRPQFPTNWDLSSARALNVMKQILGKGGFNPAKFSAIGYGEYRPIAENKTGEGRAKNRRIEVMISGSGSQDNGE